MIFHGNNVKTKGLRICLLMLLTLPAGTMTSQVQQIHIKPVKNKRLNVEPRDVITRSSAIKCESTCRQTSWCTSANMAPARGTYHLLSEEVSDVTSPETAHGWRYLRHSIGQRGLRLASIRPTLASAIKGSKRYVNLADLASRDVIGQRTTREALSDTSKSNEPCTFIQT